MPAIRDSYWIRETATADAGLGLILPGYEENDLLVACVMHDGTTIGTLAMTGWTQLFQRANACTATVFYKIAGASESDPTMTGTTNETYNGCIISIEDVDTTNPFGATPIYNDAAITMSAAGEYAMQTVSTNVANSLLLTFVAAAGTSAYVTMDRGRHHHILSGNGTAESMGVGWSFATNTGTTASDLKYEVSAGGNGVQAIMQIAPPSGGATKAPAHSVGDDSILLKHLDGTGDPAQTTTTNYAATLGGFTNNNSTETSATGNGLNFLRAGVNLGAGTLTPGNVYGSEVTFTSSNLDGRNILCHVFAPNANAITNGQPISTGGGIWMGLRSGSATDYKIWQVGGNDLPGLWGKYVPVVVNPDAVNTVASAGTLDDTALISVGFWCSGNGSSVAYTWTELWALGDAIIAGGVASDPISIDGIANAISGTKYKRSAILQGKSQLLSYQNIQIGNGGTDDVYLDLDATSIEFPSQYNQATKRTNYNSVDNKIGLIYYPGANDTIKHRNSVVSSPSRFKWGLHSSASASAAYDFTRLSVIGAGTVTLNKAITIDRLILKDYSTLNVTDATLTNCTIADVPTSNDSVTLDADTSFTGCTIDVSNVTSGNRWLSIADPSIFENCSFTGGGGHAIRITTAGTYTFSGNTATGFGANGSDGAFFFNDSGGSVTINVASSAYTPTYKNGTSASTTVNSGAALTLTGLVSGSDIVILQAGTTTELANVNANSGTTYVFNYTTAEDVDICVYKAGYEPFAIRDYTLSGEDGSVPIGQRSDRNYSNPV